MKTALATTAIIPLLLLCGGCPADEPSAPSSASGVQKANVQVHTDTDGHTIEQKNVMARLLEDNKPGSIKHLYVISAYSGDVILYSTVKGKVTSGGKRLTPSSIAVGASGDFKRPGFDVGIGRSTWTTGEVLGDDGTYGSSGDYVFWFDSKGVYHQHYMTGGQIFHVASQPLAVSKVIINVESR